MRASISASRAITQPAGTTFEGSATTSITEAKGRVRHVLFRLRSVGAVSVGRYRTRRDFSLDWQVLKPPSARPSVSSVGDCRPREGRDPAAVGDVAFTRARVRHCCRHFTNDHCFEGDEIGKLAAIVVLPTVLNYCLQIWNRRGRAKRPQVGWLASRAHRTGFRSATTSSLNESE